MIEVTKRGLILGGLSLMAAPAIVRVSSLMELRGYNMDPMVLAFRRSADMAEAYGCSAGWVLSRIPAYPRAAPEFAPYDLVRLSQTTTDRDDACRRASAALPRSTHERILREINESQAGWAAIVEY